MVVAATTVTARRGGECRCGDVNPTCGKGEIGISTRLVGRLGVDLCPMSARFAQTGLVPTGSPGVIATKDRC
jgi:hypothetical protein